MVKCQTKCIKRSFLGGREGLSEAVHVVRAVDHL